MMTEHNYTRYFRLEEAAAMIPELRKVFEDANLELGELKDDIVLHKRMLDIRLQNAEEGTTITIKKEAEEVLNLKIERYKETFMEWAHYFTGEGILLRDLERGLIDFPYQDSQGNVYLLCWCWQRDEDGIFYFHAPEDGFKGRQPITRLPI